MGTRQFPHSLQKRERNETAEFRAEQWCCFYLRHIDLAAYVQRAQLVAAVKKKG